MTPCKIFTGYVSHSGYGLLRVEGRLMYAHRHAWEQTHGKPSAQHVLQRCRNRACINPDHLFEGRQTDHQQFAIGERAGAAKLTEAQVRVIRRSYAPQIVLADRYGVSPSTISNIQRRKSWRHIL